MRGLATKYRPKRFNELTEQDNVKKILNYQLETETNKNVYLFVGCAGCGKTTSARIFAHELNGFQKASNILEIDGASNSGVDNVRVLIDKARHKPLGSKFNVFIIDECHAISASAWAAFLKLLEEPPAGSIFIFCTTDPQKIPNTILSRVERHDFKKISFNGIMNRLKYIIEQENKESDNSEEYTVTDEALEYITKVADGGMRDAIKNLDTCLSYSKHLEVKQVTEALGISGYDEMFELMDAIVCEAPRIIISTIESIYNNGRDLKIFMKQFFEFILDVVKYQFTGSFENILIPNSYESKLQNCTYPVVDILGDILDLYNKVKGEPMPKALIESTFILLTAGGK